MRAINDEGHETNYYGIISMFVLVHQVEQLYYLPYLCEKMSEWWIVHKVSPRELS
jgi:hypothetical protein